jgi:hypothetical protein
MLKHLLTPQYAATVIILNSLLTKDKEINGNETVVLNDMELTVGQINEARSGYFKGTKWGNERNEQNTKGVVPYRFHSKITEMEREVVEIILDRFNKDLKGCLSIR